MGPSVSLAATYLFSSAPKAVSGLILSLSPTNTSATALRPPVMIIQLVARNTTKSFACAQENSYCLSAQVNNTDTPPTTSAAHTPLLTRRNLTGVLVIVVLFVLGTALWLCFGKWSKPIRHFFKGKSRSSSSFKHATSAIASVPRRADLEKAEISLDSSSSSTQSSLLDDQDAIKINDGSKVELTLPAKVLQIKSGSRIAGLVR